MGKKTDPVITKCKESDNWTKVTFKPDLAKFNMTYLEEDVVALMKKRVFDMAGCLGRTVKVELNGKRIAVKSFLDYVDLYLRSARKTDAEISRFFFTWQKLIRLFFFLSICFFFANILFDHFSAGSQRK